MTISVESYERVTAILDDINDVCEIKDYYEDWEEMARPSFCTFLDDLDPDQYDMTCAAVKERITELNAMGERNLAMGIRTAFYGYLTERRDYLDFNGFYDEPDKPDDDADEDELDEYREAMEIFGNNKAYTDVVEKWIETIGNLELK